LNLMSLIAESERTARRHLPQVPSSLAPPRRGPAPFRLPLDPGDGPLITVDSQNAFLRGDYRGTGQSYEVEFSVTRDITFAEEKESDAGPVFLPAQAQDQGHITQTEISLGHTLLCMATDAILADPHIDVLLHRELGTM
jgi:hypothetical protein